MMNTLLFHGSPHDTGDTAALLAALRCKLTGECRTVDAYRAAIHPCIDCRYCWTHPGCCIDDDMQEIYPAIIEADAIVIASPVYFSELTGPLLSTLSRLQMFYASRCFRGVAQISHVKRGGIILCGGGDGRPDRAEATAGVLLRMMGAQPPFFTVQSLNTNSVPAREDAHALAQIVRLADFLTKEAADSRSNL